MVDVIEKPYVTFAAYLEAEQRSDLKHEWFNGAVYAMSRGTPEHARLSARIVRLLGNALPGDCEVYSSDMMLYLSEAKLSTYADGTVVCGPLETIM
jgi:Uma2 family endonuclease